jgi:hypothetical protein
MICDFDQVDSRDSNSRIVCQTHEDGVDKCAAVDAVVGIEKTFALRLERICCSLALPTEGIGRHFKIGDQVADDCSYGPYVRFTPYRAVMVIFVGLFLGSW